MKQIMWNQNWTVAAGVTDPFAVIFGGGAEGKPVILPQDAMILEKRSPDCGSGTQSGFYPAKSYTYQKEFFAPLEWKESWNVLEFEGVMSKAFVCLNGELVHKNKNGYSQFFVDLNRYLRYGEQNTLKVVAVNQEHGSRWYPGSGIYRSVNLHQGGMIHVPPEGIRIATEEIRENYAVVSVETALQNTGIHAGKVTVCCRGVDEQGNQAAGGENTVSLLAAEETVSRMKLTVDAPSLWSPEHPALYRLILEIREGEKLWDQAAESFGIRMISADAREGLRINGEEVKLRGACIHHDNGILGATTLKQAEEFRLRKLKEAGFNSIRSAHHPAGKTMLSICDRLGLLVMDELTDMWDQPKNSGDYALEFGEEWEQDLEKMVAKDYNHPSVILYSLGNEIPEIGRRSGGRRNRQLANYLRSLDSTRLVTGAFSGFLAVVDRLGDWQESSGDGAEGNGGTAYKAQVQPENVAEPGPDSSRESGGSEGMNAVMGSTEQEMLDAFSVSPMLSQCLEEASCELDVVGYNYLTARHAYEHTLHPDRVVVGSETYPPEIARLWKIVKDNPHVIGDFTWTGYDYLGEAGIAIFHYNTERREQGWYPDRLAYCGDININGYRRPVSYLREIVYGLRREPWIAVERPERHGMPCNTNSWMYRDAIDSWTFTGMEGKPARIHIRSASQEVELFLNGRSLGRKPAGETAGYDALFETVYEPGELVAAGYSEGREDGRFRLITAGEPAAFAVSVSCDSLTADGQSVAFITADLVDEKGTANRWEAREVRVSVEGAGTLAGFGSAAPSTEGSYDDNIWRTYDGRVMAAVRSGQVPGAVSVKISTQGCGTESISIPVLEGEIQ